MHFYQHNIGDFDKATRHLSRVERSVYRDLIEFYYDIEQPLPLDIQSICRKIIAKSNEESTAVEQVLSEFFNETPLGWYHIRCEEELERYRCSTSQKSEAGKASAAKKKEKLQQALNGKSTSVEQTFNGASTKQETINNIHEPITIKTKKPPTATRLPIDWQPSETDYLFAKQERPDINPRSTADQFRDYWIAKSGKDATKADWSATWRNWVRRQTATKQGYESAADKTRKTIEGLTGRAANEQRDFIDIN